MALQKFDYSNYYYRTNLRSFPPLFNRFNGLDVHTRYFYCCTVSAPLLPPPTTRMGVEHRIAGCKCIALTAEPRTADRYWWLIIPCLLLLWLLTQRSALPCIRVMIIVCVCVCTRVVTAYDCSMILIQVAISAQYWSTVLWLSNCGGMRGNGVPLPFLARERRSPVLAYTTVVGVRGKRPSVVRWQLPTTQTTEKRALNAWFKVTPIVYRGNFKSCIL